MELFLSSCTNRLDAKGRVSIPPAFRAILAREGFEGLYVHPSLEAQALDCGGNALLARINAMLASLPPYCEAHDAYAAALLGTSEVLKLDAEGRAVLPENLKIHAGISSEVTFVGLGSKFQIWEPAHFRAHLEAAQCRVRAWRNGLLAAGMASLPLPAQGARE